MEDSTRRGDVAVGKCMHLLDILFFALRRPMLWQVLMASTRDENRERGRSHRWRCNGAPNTIRTWPSPSEGASQNENDLAQAIRSDASNSTSQTGQQFVQRQLNIQPTLTIRLGFPVRVIVTLDLVLAPTRREEHRDDIQAWTARRRQAGQAHRRAAGGGLQGSQKLRLSERSTSPCLMDGSRTEPELRLGRLLKVGVVGMAVLLLEPLEEELAVCGRAQPALRARRQCGADPAHAGGFHPRGSRLAQQEGQGRWNLSGSRVPSAHRHGSL